MTTIRQIVTDAFREGNIVAVGDTPGANEFDEAVRRLQNIYASLFAHELGEPLSTYNYDTEGVDSATADIDDISDDVDSNFVPMNTRLVLNIGSAKTLLLHPNPKDGARFAVIDNAGNLATYNVTVDGNGRQVELADTLTLNTNSLNREWFYRADLGNWARVTDLDADAQSPLPTEFDDLLITMLAIRIGPRYGAKTSEEMVEVLKRIRKQFRARYRQSIEMASESGLLLLPSNRQYRWFKFNG